MTDPVRRRAAVLGSPVAHSLSPVLHRAAHAALGLTGWTYDAYDVAADDLRAFLGGLDEQWAGLSLTMPLKAVVLPMLDDCSPLVRAVGAANTVVLSGGRRLGENTDVPGMVAALAERGVGRVARAAVLGGGATARAAVAALAGLTTHVAAYVRSPERAAALRETAAAVGVSLQVKDWSDAASAMGCPLVVATTPAGAADEWASAVPPSAGALFDVRYDPWPTPLAVAWTARGGTVLSGLDLLVHQAVPQVALFAGSPVDGPALVAVLRRAGERALRPD